MRIDSLSDVFNREQNYLHQRIIEDLNDPEWQKSYKEYRKKFPENFKDIKITFRSGKTRIGYYDGQYYITTDSKYWMENGRVQNTDVVGWEYID